MLGVWDHIKNHCEQCERAANFALDWVGMVPGKRESRRFIGDYVLKHQDIQQRRLFEDRVGFGGWEIDDHTKEGILDTTKKPSFEGVRHRDYFVAPYSVPYSCMTTPETLNLLLAGRILSASRLAFNSLRVMETLAALGEAAGLGAAIAAEGDEPADVHLRQADIGRLQQAILRRGLYIPRQVNQDADDLARQAVLTASSEASFVARPDEEGMSLREPLAQLVPIGAPGRATVSAWLRHVGDQAVDMQARLCRAQDIWDLPPLSTPPASGRGPQARTISIEPGHSGPASWSFEGVEPGIYWLRIDAVDQPVTWLYAQDDIPGTTAAAYTEERWWFAPHPFTRWRNLMVDVTPDPGYYDACQATSGVSRPEQWSNLWRSDPAAPLPQWIELRWPEPVEMGRVECVFDAEIKQPARENPPLYRHASCVRDLDVWVERRGSLDLITSLRGNVQRRRVIAFDPVVTSRLRLSILATHGSPDARVYEARVYRG